MMAIEAYRLLQPHHRGLAIEACYPCLHACEGKENTMSQISTDYSSGSVGRRGLEEAYARREQLSREAVDEGWGSQRGYEPAQACLGNQNVGETERAISVASGVGLAVIGLMRGRWDGLLLGALGGGLVWRGLTGRCQVYAALGIDTAKQSGNSPAIGVPAQQGEKVERAITVRRTPAEVYQFWRNLENLPQVMSHLQSVTALDSSRSRWIAKGPLGQELEWEAEIWNERENELIAWRSLPGGDVDTAGSIHFKPSTQPGYCDVTVSMKYNPPAGKVGARIAHWLGDGLEPKIAEDLQRFKKAMELTAPVASIAERGTALGQ
jgi:uncharacterized membrane protein